MKIRDKLKEPESEEKFSQHKFYENLAVKYGLAYTDGRPNETLFDLGKFCFDSTKTEHLMKVNFTPDQFSYLPAPYSYLDYVSNLRLIISTSLVKVCTPEEAIKRCSELIKARDFFAERGYNMGMGAFVNMNGWIRYNSRASADTVEKLEAVLQDISDLDKLLEGKQ